MDCHEARERFREHLVGDLNLTEWATVEAHVGQCEECGPLLDQLYRLTPLAQRRRPAATLWMPRPGRSRPPLRLLRLAVVTTVLVSLVGLGIYALGWRHGSRLAELRSAPPTASEPGTSKADRRVQAATPEPVVPPPVGLAVEPEPQDVVEVKRAPRAPAAKNQLQVEPVVPAAARPTDIVVHLSVPDRKAAARDVKTLLARIGGKSLGPDPAATMVVVVPRSGYAELTRGLAQIGAWQMESDPGSLPDPVHVAVRLAR